MRFGSRFVVTQHFFIFQAAEEFDLAELLGLEAARGIQDVAEREEVSGEHGLENGELLHQHAHDLRAAAKQPGGLVHFIARSGIAAGGAQVRDDRIQVVQQLAEPQLIGLVNDDEQQFVVVGGRGFADVEGSTIPELGSTSCTSSCSSSLVPLEHAAERRPRCGNRQLRAPRSR